MIFQPQNNKIDFRQVQTLAKSSFSIQKFGSILRNYIDNFGFIILQNFFSDLKNVVLIEKEFLTLCASIGTITSHTDDKNNYVWKIIPRSNLDYSATFSEHSFEAKLHTDSQYQLKPEKYMALSAIRKAKCGGGKSIILDVASLIEKLNSTAQGKKYIKILQNEVFPFAVPDIFRKKKFISKIIFAPILSQEPTLRYRFDTIQNGFRLAEISKSDKRFKAFEFLNQLIESCNNKFEFLLEDGEMLFLNNHRTLHGRTKFGDKNRLLLRIRMN